MIAIVIGKHFHEAQYRFQSNWRGRRDTADISDDLAQIGDSLTNLAGNALEVAKDVATSATKDIRLRSQEDAMAGGKNMTYGIGVFCAVGSGFINILAGILMISQGCGDNDEYDDDEYTQGKRNIVDQNYV